MSETIKRAIFQEQSAIDFCNKLFNEEKCARQTLNFLLNALKRNEVEFKMKKWREMERNGAK